jgi:hypothetical protein
MYAGYGYGLNGTEIWNNLRVLDYLSGNPATFTLPMRNVAQYVNRGAECSNVLSLVCDPPLSGDRYTSPAGDDAPWYDPQIPESADFAGLYVEEVTGFDSVVERSISTAAIYGGALGPLKLGPRQITVTGYLFASTCCAAEYGLHWLTEALIASSGCDDCGLGDFYMLKCCPPDDVYEPDPADYARIMLRTGLLDGPKVVDKFGTCCDACGYTTLKVQFTIASELPYLFSDLSYALFEEPFDPEEQSLDFYGFCDDCPPVAEEIWTPECGGVTLAPPQAFTITDPCYCDPWCSKKLCATVQNVADWNSLSTVVEVAAGSATLKNLKISVWANKAYELGVPCPCDDIGSDEYWKCREPCNVLQIAEMPSGSKLMIDSRQRVALLELAGGSIQSALRLISSPGTTGIEWLDLPQCTTFCFIVTADCTVADDATVSIATAGRFHASGG